MTIGRSDKEDWQHMIPPIEDRRVLIHRQLVAAHEYQLRATDTWGIEVLKTLFLLNAAGLAGVFTLAQTVTPRASLPFVPFALGIALAVASLTFGRYMHSAGARGWKASAACYAKSFSDKDTELKNPREVGSWEFAQIICAYGSAICCLWAGYCLYKLFSMLPSA